MLARIFAVLLLTVPTVRGQDSFFRVPIVELSITEGAWPEEKNGGRWVPPDFPRPYALLDGPGEAYLTTVGDEQDVLLRTGAVSSRWSRESAVLVARAGGADLTGTMYVPAADGPGLSPLRFSLGVSKASSNASHAFYAAKARHYEALQLSGSTGTAWFRYQAAQARKALGQKPNTEEPAPAGEPLSSTYDLFSGGRAMSENLQLYRPLPTIVQEPAAPDEVVAVSSIQGITIRAMDWSAVAGASPKLDTLASAIPADQHVAFFPSIEALTATLEHIGQEGLPLARALESRSPDERVLKRYEKQLGVTVLDLKHFSDGTLIRSIGITGSDPYFATGTDVAVLFEATEGNGPLLHRTLSHIRFEDGVTESGDTVEGLAYRALETPSRAVSSFIASLGDSVVLTNSLAQLRRLAMVRAGKEPSIATLDEYRYFRSRYPVGAEFESAFVFISDPTIRRWCGPEWRIAASRRLRASAILADVTAAHIDDLFPGVDQPRIVQAETPMRTIGTLTMNEHAVSSSVYGSLTFQTPIVELGLKEVGVTKDEAAAYDRWRKTYQSNWSWAFDPIGISLSIRDNRLAADLTIMPLIAGTQYRTWFTIAQGAAIAAGAGDPHDSLFHAVLAINSDSEAAHHLTGLSQMAVPNHDIDVFNWLGTSVALYADPDPMWHQLAVDAAKDNRFEDRMSDLPVAVYVEVASPLKLAAFLVAARKLADESGPGMLAWETRDHAGQGYVRVGLNEAARADAHGGFDAMSLYYAAMPKALILSLNEGVLKRAIDRERIRRTDPNPAAHPWLGESLCLQFGKDGAGLLDELLGDSGRLTAWSNIPILNEWKRRFPDKDPVAVHERLWGALPDSPGGGRFDWDPAHKTVFSTEFGSPIDPRNPAISRGPLSGIAGGNFGVTFENQGLRARIEIDWEPNTDRPGR